MLKIVYLSLVLLTNCNGNLLEKHQKLNPFERLITDIVDAMNPYRILLFMKEKVEEAYLEAEYIKKFLLNHFPTVMIDFRNMAIVEEILIYPSFGSPKYSTLFVSIFTPIEDRSANFTEISQLLSNYVDLLPRASRPRWLIILVNDELSENKNIEAFLRESWRKKFLDLTMLEMISGELDFDKILLHTFNPFEDRYNATLYADTSKLFPDKLRDMNGYNVTIFFYDDPPTLRVQRNLFGQVIKISGNDYKFVATLSSVVNFTIDAKTSIEDLKIGDYKEPEILAAIEDGAIAMSGNRIFLWEGQPLERSMIVKPDGICMLVPIIEGPSAVTSKRFYFGLLMTMFHVVSLVYAARWMRFDKHIWTWINVFRVILGVSMPRQPGSLAERMMIGCIIVLSLSYTSVLYAKLTDKHLKGFRELPFNSYKELDESGLIPLVPEHYYNASFDTYENEKETLQRIKRRARFWEDSLSCAEEMLRYKKSACVMNENLGYYLMDRHRDEEGGLRMKLMKPCFWSTWKCIAFAPGSPYVERFDLVVTWIFEAGFAKHWADDDKPRNEHYAQLKLTDGKSILEQMYIVLSVGYALASLVFFVELLVHYVNSTMYKID